MENNRIEIIKSQIKTLIKSMQFSALDSSTQTYVNNEQLYFNNRRVLAIVWAIFAVESWNILNVLCFSNSGLATPNNRQYFAMYLLLFASGAICILIRHLLREKQELLRCCYAGFTMFWVVWHSILTAMDLRHNPNIMVFATAVFGISFLMRLKPKETLCILPGGYLVLILLAGSRMSSGTMINTAIVTMVSILISLSRYLSTLEEIGYRQKMVLQEEHRMTEKQKLNLIIQQQAALLEYSREFLFTWDRESNTLNISGERQFSGRDKQILLAWLLRCEDKSMKGSLEFYLENGLTQCHTYLVDVTLQLDCDGCVIGGVGQLIPWKELMEWGRPMITPSDITGW